MGRDDWTLPAFSDAPADLRSILAGARLEAIDNDRAAREIRLRFTLPADAGTPDATFVVKVASHLMTFAYLPPAQPLTDGLPPEEAVAAVGDWARQGLIATADPLLFGTSAIVDRARLHVLDDRATLTLEGYGEEADRLVWWEIRVSGASVEAIEGEMGPLQTS